MHTNFLPLTALTSYLYYIPRGGITIYYQYYHLQAPFTIPFTNTLFTGYTGGSCCWFYLNENIIRQRVAVERYTVDHVYRVYRIRLLWQPQQMPAGGIYWIIFSAIGNLDHLLWDHELISMIARIHEQHTTHPFSNIL